MTISYIILWTSMIFWFMTIFTQRKSSVFIFFLMMGLSDPLIYAIRVILLTNNQIIYPILSFIILLALRTNNFKSFQIRVWDSVMVAAVIVFLLVQTNLFYFTHLIHVFILVEFIKRIISALHDNGKINIYFLVLVFYEISLITKVIVYSSGLYTGYLLFSLTLAFQILIALFFLFFREDNPKLIIKMT